MRRPLRLPVCILTLVVAASALQGCGDTAKPPAAAAQGAPPPTSTADAKLLAEQAKASDEVCRGLLDSFERRAYDPRRDGKMQHVEGVIDVNVNGRSAKYKLVYDVANPANAPVAVTVVSEPADLKAGLVADVRRWAMLSCAGGYGLVVCYRPPIQLSLTPSSKPGNYTVYAPPFQTQACASYSIDARQVVEARSEWTDPKQAFTTSYEWEVWHGLYLLRRSVLYQGATTEFEYDDRLGPKLVGKVHVRDGEQRTEAVIAYGSIQLAH